MSDTDLTFITNEGEHNLLGRFKALIGKDTQFFDALVGYFYTSGFYKLYPSLEDTEKIRILIGLKTDRETLDRIQETGSQSTLSFSHAETKEQYTNAVAEEMENSEDNEGVEEGVQKFKEWLRSGKLEIKAYPTAKIHAKLYVMSFLEGGRDKGRVITGSSNFSASGFVDNLEFNIELKNRSDYEFAKNKFDELWEDSVDVSKKYVETINEKTWLNDKIQPYELYLKFLYEYFKEDLARSENPLSAYLPSGFKKLEYQEQAVFSARKVLDEYGGVFVSDVVGLGKTYISAMLARELDGLNLVLAPPGLLDRKNPGSWPNVFEDFQVRQTRFESIGQLDKLEREGVGKYTNVFIDESHRFRSETTIGYEKLAQICRGKRVILVTATPYNNSPRDLLSQIKLFQNVRKSTIPGTPDLEHFFRSLDGKLKNLDRQKDYEAYIKTVKENAREIREKVLKYLMIRRTRSEIVKYFARDLKEQKLKFPEVENPEPIFYQLNKSEDAIFSKTIELVMQQFHYARYTPLLYYKGEVTQPERLAQQNMGRFIRILLVKRLESSFYAFRNTLKRFIHTYEQFLKEYDRGYVYVSKGHTNKIFELLENDDEDAIERLIEEEKAERFSAEDFRKEFRLNLESDLRTLQQVHAMWEEVTRDPKLIAFQDKLSSNSVLKKQKLIIFSESKETTTYLKNELSKAHPETVLMFTGSSSADEREKVIENFDARARFLKDDYRILITTDVLAEGVNLHRSNVVINYDLPWNPTRLMQRVGRINRVDTQFDRIFTFNFFPTTQANTQIKLKEIAESKIHAFITLLGADARLLTEGEPVESHELFRRLTSKKTITGEDETDESELKYLQVIKTIREEQPDIFEKVKRLPKKARTARSSKEKGDKLLTYFRKGKLQKFFLAQEGKEATELDFLESASILEASAEEKRAKIGKNYHTFLKQNKEVFHFTATEEDLLDQPKARGGRDSATQIAKILKAVRDQRQFTEEQEEFLKTAIQRLEAGSIPKQTTKNVLQELNKELEQSHNSLRLLGIVEKGIPAEFLCGHIAESVAKTAGPREVILSEYFAAGNG